MPGNANRRNLGGALLALALSLATPAWPAPSGFKPNLGPDLPAITVQCADLTLLLRQASQWTAGRIDYRGAPMTTERSAYGTVLSFPGTGFIGTAHLENEPEPLQSLRFFVDDREVAAPGPRLQGRRFRLERVSAIRGLELHCQVELRDNRLWETTRLQAKAAVPLKLLYHFMHAWQPGVSAFLAGRDGDAGPAFSGQLGDGDATARKFFVNEKVDWLAVYEPVSRQFAVSRLLAAPDRGGHVSMLWNVPGSYRKYYLKCFEDAAVPAGFSGTWRMVTGFGAAAPENWAVEAQRLAGALRGP